MKAKEKYQELEKKTDSILIKLVESPLTMVVIVAIALLLIVIGSKIF